MCFRPRLLPLVIVALAVVASPPAFAQELGGAGTVQGTVKDTTGGVMQAVTVTLTQHVTGQMRTTVTDAMGQFIFRNVAPNSYHLSIDTQGFTTFERDVDVRSGVPIDLTITLEVGVTEAVSVVGKAEDLVERDPTAHTDVDQSAIAKLPLASSTSGLNQVVALEAPGVAEDSNGFFHPLGDHAQTQFSIDNQPITDQQSRVYSNQISPDAVQSIEIITGVPPAEYGDKSSLVVHIVTKSGLDSPKPFGDASFGYGSFRTPTANVNLGGGSKTVGDFVSLNGMRTDRYLDPPEFQALHDRGNAVTFFNRFDAHSANTATFHLNVQAARSDFDVPNTYDQNAAGQAQHQHIDNFNVAPGYSQVIGNKTLLTANAFIRHDHLTYSPSPDPLADQSASISQDRTLTNFGVKADVAYATAHNNIKLGATASATRLGEQFSLGFTDPATSADLTPDLRPFDLTRGGTPFRYNQSGTVKQQAFYVQDEATAGKATFKLGVRVDHYDGLTTATMAEPRLGVSYAVPMSGTVLRASYGRTMETPYNENLLLSSGVGLNGLFGDTQTLQPGRRNEGEFGVQQAFGKWAVADVGYFVKRTTNAYDFNVLFNTPIVFPVAWDHSDIDGFTGRVALVPHGGFSASITMGHTNAIYFPPGTGGLLLESPCEGAGCSFRIDHDQKFQQATNLQYVFAKSVGAWAALSWRYESGPVTGGADDVLGLLDLTADQQAAAGVTCGGRMATLTSPITSCAASSLSASRLSVPAAGTGDPLNNPTRIAPRNMVDLGFGVDNVLHTNTAKLKLRFSIINVGNTDALYNFLSTFSGTHFVTPRAYQAQIGVSF